MASACNVCGRAVEWARTPSGRNVPLDPEPSPTGMYVRLGDGRAYPIPDALLAARFDAPEVQAERRDDHHKTCGLRGLISIASSARGHSHR